MVSNSSIFVQIFKEGIEEVEMIIFHEVYLREVGVDESYVFDLQYLLCLFCMLYQVLPLFYTGK